MADVAPPDAYRSAVAQVGATTLAALEGMEVAERHLHPPQIPRLRQMLGVVRDRLEDALEAFAAVPPDEPVLRSFHDRLAQGAGETLEALRLFVDPGAPHEATARILGSLAQHRRAQATLYALRNVLPALGAYFRIWVARNSGSRKPTVSNFFARLRYGSPGSSSGQPTKFTSSNTTGALQVTSTKSMSRLL